MSKPVKVLTDVQCKKLLNDTKDFHKTPLGKLKGIRNFLMTILMLDAGVRVGELVQIEIQDLFFAGRPRESLIIRSEIAKNHKERIVPLTTRALQAIQMMEQWIWFRQCPDSKRFAFYNSNSESPIGVRLVQKMIGESSQRSIGERVHPHALRHTFATRLMRTTGISVVQTLLGHSNLNSTQVYMHPNSNDLATAIRGIDGTKEESK